MTGNTICFNAIDGNQVYHLHILRNVSIYISTIDCCPCFPQVLIASIDRLLAGPVLLLARMVRSFLSIIVLAAGLSISALSAGALPLEKVRSVLTNSYSIDVHSVLQRENGKVFYCKGTGFQAESGCQEKTFNNGVCVEMDADFISAVNSFRPDGKAVCMLYSSVIQNFCNIYYFNFDGITGKSIARASQPKLQRD